MQGAGRIRHRVSAESEMLFQAAVPVTCGRSGSTRGLPSDALQGAVTRDLGTRKKLGRRGHPSRRRTGWGEIFRVIAYSSSSYRLVPIAWATRMPWICPCRRDLGVGRGQPAVDASAPSSSMNSNGEEKAPAEKTAVEKPILPAANDLVQHDRNQPRKKRLSSEPLRPPLPKLLRRSVETSLLHGSCRQAMPQRPAD